jgi:hypothetical protein
MTHGSWFANLDYRHKCHLNIGYYKVFSRPTEADKRSFVVVASDPGLMSEGWMRRAKRQGSDARSANSSTLV